MKTEAEDDEPGSKNLRDEQRLQPCLLSRSEIGPLGARHAVPRLELIFQHAWFVARGVTFQIHPNCNEADDEADDPEPEETNQA